MNENQGSQGPKQKIVEKIKDSANILVTVSKNPSVDELSAALGLTLMLDQLSKHPTAVVSGQIPPAISFLDPEKTFENTVDSLRDFIIALDKEKADHLRYKVDGDVVKIFITPYRTTISENDLQFSQGDYNVELVLALGVDSQDNLDAALSAHGKIFHDATVASLSVGSEKSNLGSINWHESGASSICEMIVSLSEAFKSDKKLLTEQVATAFLTGIVAATDRFSNEKTSSKVMTIAAQLMAAGANQQLIAAKLEENDAISRDGSSVSSDSSSTVSDQEAASEKQDDVKSQATASAAGTLAISHEKKGDLEEVAKQTVAEQQEDAVEQAENSLAEQLKTVAPVAAPVVSINDEIIKEGVVKTEAPADEPSFGGTLNATTEQAAETKRLEDEADRNKTILTHGGGAASYARGSAPSFTAPFNAAAQDDAGEPPTVDIFSDESDRPTQSAPVEPVHAISAPEPVGQAPSIDPLPTVPAPSTAASFETLADIDRKNRADMHSNAQAAVAAAFGGDNSNPATPEAVPPLPSFDAPVLIPPIQPATPGLPPLPDFSQMPQPALPPLPQFGTAAGAMSSEQLGQLFGSPAQQVPVAPNQPPDPNQFKIPGQ
jgi:hypothetical protein